MPHDETTAEESAGVESRHRDVSKESLKWHPWRLIHWFIFGGGVVYTIWSLSVSIESEFIVSDVPEAFTPSLYGFQRKQDNMQFGWTITRSYLRDSLKWLLLHPILGRATAYAAPSLVPVFHSVYSLLAVASVFSWEVAVLFLCEHALFYGITALRNPALSYIITLFILGQNYIFTSPNLGYFSRKHGPLCYMVTYVAFYWNIARCLSFSVDFLKAERLKPEESRCRWPPYWKTLAYVIYVPTVYLGPLQNYDDYVGQVDKDRPACTPQEIACSIARFLRCGAHFALMEAMTHFIYSGTMARFSWLIEELDNTCICGFVMATHFFFYVRYLFTYGFAGALASAEGIEIPPPAKCVGRMSKASQFWRYLDRGMHLYIRRYFYEPVQGNRKTPGWILIGTAAAFSFTWCWHGMRKGDGIWCFLCVVCLSFEALVTEVRKLRFMKSFEARYLGTPERMREAAAVLGSPQYLLTIVACLFHVVNVEVSFTVCKRALFGFPFPLLPVLVAMYSACHISFDALQWEEEAEKRKNS